MSIDILVELTRTGSARVIVRAVHVDDPGGEVPPGYNHVHPSERRKRWLAGLHHDKACEIVRELLDGDGLAGNLTWQFTDVEINDTDLPAGADEEDAVIVDAADSA
jgi:hypothetical protein